MKNIKTREIKFRAWNKPQKRLMSWKECSTSFRLKDIETDIDIYDFMQFTGLKDRNGVEIYEGDRDESGHVIMWSEKHCLFCLHYYQQFYSQWVEASYPIDASRILIVGNIYEQPNLINQ